MTEVTKEAFAAFCESKPADEGYLYFDNQNCAFAQFLKHLGIESPLVSRDRWRPDINSKSCRLPRGVSTALSSGSFTFGALAQRLREEAA